MTFLHPALLYALPAAAVPILLHFLVLRRLRTIDLSTFRFLLDTYARQRRRLQFLEAFLAGLRALILVILVLVASRPIVQHWRDFFPEGSGNDIILMFDCSASMNARAAGLSALERARSAARALFARLTPSDRIRAFRVSRMTREIYRGSSADASAFHAQLDQLRLSAGRANFLTAFGQVFGTALQPQRPLVYVFTDCQRGDWQELKAQGLDQSVPRGTSITVVNVGSRSPVANVAITGDIPRTARSVVGLPVTLTARVVNFSNARAEATLAMLIDDKEIARFPLSLIPHETVSRRAAFIPTEPGFHRGRFEISPRTPDGFSDDNTFCFTLIVEPPTSVLLINGGPSPNPREDEAAYLRAALAPEPNHSASPSRVPSGARDHSAARLSLRETTETDFNAPMLADVQVAILANCGALARHQMGWLHDYVAHGGGLVIFPGDHVQSTSYSQWLRMPGPLGETLSAAGLTTIEGHLEEPQTFQRLAMLAAGHPMWQALETEPCFRSTRFYRRFRLDVPEKSPQTMVLARFADQSPALVESRLHAGTTIVAAFPAHPRWTNLPLKPEFVPLVLNLVACARRPSEMELPTAVWADAVVPLRLGGEWYSPEGTVTNPLGQKQPLHFDRTADGFAALVRETDSQGFYSVEVRGGDAQRKRRICGTFAVNTDTDESNFEVLSEEELQALIPQARVQRVDASAEARQESGEPGMATEAWRPLAGVLFGLIGAEFLLATVGATRKPRRTWRQRAAWLNPSTWASDPTWR